MSKSRTREEAERLLSKNAGTFEERLGKGYRETPFYTAAVKAVEEGASPLAALAEATRHVT